MNKHGKHHKRRRGVHKNARSPEVLAWERDHLLSDPPAWMDARTYNALGKLHRDLLVDRP